MLRLNLEACLSDPSLMTRPKLQLCFFFVSSLLCALGSQVDGSARLQGGKQYSVSWAETAQFVARLWSSVGYSPSAQFQCVLLLTI